jgi:exodeoxyribonuclease VII small subunit
VSDETTGQPIAVSFEAGMARLEEISHELDSGDASLDRTIELMKEGKGLEQALRTYLDRAAERLTAIEQGEMATLYEIVSISDSAQPAQQPPTQTPPSSHEDPGSLPPERPPASAQDDLFGAPADDVPF